MTRKRKQTTKSGLRKRSKSKSVQKEKEKLSLPELSNLDKNVNRVLSENWRLLEDDKITFELENIKPGRSLLNDHSDKREPIDFFRKVMTDELIQHIKKILNRNLQDKVIS